MSISTQRQLRAVKIAKILFEDQGYHIIYLEEIETILRERRKEDGRIDKRKD